MTAPLWTSDEVAAATGGRSTAPWQATGVSIDTRNLQPGDVFVALVGERFDGHAFLDYARARGAAAAIVSHAASAEATADMPLHYVEDTLAGLYAMARAAQARSRARVVAVTGSVGKTSTKEALGAALSRFGETATSHGNLNNHFGVPLSLARLPATASYAVWELGMSGPHELAALSQLAQPDVAIITAVAAAHLENFNSVAEIADAKAEILDGLGPDGCAVLNRDNPYFERLLDHARRRGIAHIKSFGRSEAATAQLLSRAAREDTGSHVTARVADRELAFELAAPGEHNARNAMAVLAAVAALGQDPAAAAPALADVGPPDGRGRRRDVTLPGGGQLTVLDESYNAAPAAVRAALAVLGDARPGPGGRRLAFLGDMLELGPDAPSLHAGLADAVVACGIDAVATCGELMANLDAALPAERRLGQFCDADTLAAAVGALVGPGDVVMVKGSYGVRMARVLTALLELGAAGSAQGAATPATRPAGTGGARPASGAGRQRSATG